MCVRAHVYLHLFIVGGIFKTLFSTYHLHMKENPKWNIKSCVNKYECPPGNELWMVKEIVELYRMG